jgi:tRNA-splicing ligase RtcB
MSERLNTWLIEPLSPDVRQALERLARSDDVERVAVMPDVHLAEDVCVGVAVATKNLIYPSAVGGDIGCGMAAVQLGVTTEQVDRRDVAARILAGFERRVPVMAHRGAVPLEDELRPPLAAEPLRREAARNAERQFATLGRGNHFLEVGADDEGQVWLTVHTGSRGIGPGIREFYASRGRESCVGLAVLDADSQLGAAYLADLAWALRFARASRAAILASAAEVIAEVAGGAAAWETLVECEHNHVERVDDGGVSLWVHRKGAICALDGRAGIIPGSMGSATYHVVGRGKRESLWSSSHGAGRAMSRSEARKRIRMADLERDVRGVWFDHRKKARLIDEAPSAYKDISRVMRGQSELTRIVRRLQPLLSYKGV